MGKRRWKKIPHFDYEVSTYGEVKNSITGKILKPIKITQKGTKYYSYAVTLYINKKQKRFYIHILVCEAFIGPRPKNAQVRHLDGDHENCYYKNLKWGSIAENNKDKIIHNTMSRGVNHGIAVLNDTKVIRIRRLGAKGTMTYAAIGRKFGVCAKSIGNVINRKTWQHVADPP